MHHRLEKSESNQTGLVVVLTTVSLSLLILVVVLLTSRSQTSLTQKGSQASPSASLTAHSLMGKKAPDFELEDFEGQRVSLKSLEGKTVVLFFSEGLMCYPACWDQMAKLGLDPRFNNETTIAYSIIVDQKSQWQKAFEKMPPLRQTKVLFDVYASASRDFETLNLPSSMHPGRIPGHTYFIIDKEGIVRYFYDDPQMGIRNDLLFEEIKKIL